MSDGILQVPPKPRKPTAQLSCGPNEQRIEIELETRAINVHLSAMFRLGLELPSYEFNVYWVSKPGRCEEMKLTIYRKLGRSLRMRAAISPSPQVHYGLVLD
jgi:hypothetical protein